MTTSERRVTRRLKLHIPISFHRIDADAPSEVEEKAKAINISTRGVYFLSNLEISVGEALEVRLAMPRRLTGTSSATRTFTARVSHVETCGVPEGQSGIGVQLLYYERDLIRPSLVEAQWIRGCGDLTAVEPIRETRFSC
jgi:hypothetical protein